MTVFQILMVAAAIFVSYVAARECIKMIKEINK